MGTSEFAEGDVVTTTAFPALEGLEGTLRREPEQANFPWRLVLTRASQAAYNNVPVEKVVPGSAWEADRLNGWLVNTGEIQKVEG